MASLTPELLSEVDFGAAYTLPKLEEGQGDQLVLNQAQREAVSSPPDQSLLILAAAGSGKTLVLCHRILFLLSEGVQPCNILAVTFTRRAGQDLLHRVRQAATTSAGPSQHGGPGSSLAARCQDVRVCTFHSFCLSLLRMHSVKAGLQLNFTVYTPRMQTELLLELVHAYYCSRQGQAPPQELLEPLAGLPSEQRSQLRSEALRMLQRMTRVQAAAGAGSSQDIQKEQEGNDMFTWVYNNYKRRLRENNGVDFNGFVRCSLELLRNNPDVLASVKEQAQYILVDEFQDTDGAQFELIRLLCSGGQQQRLTVVGDDDQQIYTFRGATGLRNLAAFKEAFPEARTVWLEQNFRSSGSIVASARAVIQQNWKRHPKSMRTAAPFGTKMAVCECRTEACEAAAIATAIHCLHHSHHIPYQDMAVLYRLQRVGLELLQSLRSHGVPCHFKGSSSGSVLDTDAEGGTGSWGGGGAFEDVLAVLRLVVSEEDNQACSHLLHLCLPPLSFPPSLSACLQHLHLAHQTPLFRAVQSTRAHFLNLHPCAPLLTTPHAKAFALLPPHTKQQALEGLGIVTRIVSAACLEAQHLTLTNLIRNVLNQVEPFREAEPAGDRFKKGERNKGEGKFQFAGIKALLKEAELCDSQKPEPDAERWSRGAEAGPDTPTPLSSPMSPTPPRGSYAELRRKKGRRAPPASTPNPLQHLLRIPRQIRTPDRSAPTPLSTSRPANSRQVARMQQFLDRVALRCHDRELGVRTAPAPRQEARRSQQEPPEDKVTLTTIHQAKGLEWSAVIVARVNEGVLPLSAGETSQQETPPQPLRALETGGVAGGQEAVLVKPPVPGGESDSVEEERRLMYVALTRARHYLTVTHVVSEAGQQRQPSRFLREIPPGLVNRTFKYDSAVERPCSSQQATASPSDKELEADQQRESPLRERKKNLLDHAANMHKSKVASKHSQEKLTKKGKGKVSARDRANSAKLSSPLEKCNPKRGCKRKQTPRAETSTPP